jgi:hypothetical protein
MATTKVFETDDLIELLYSSPLNWISFRTMKDKTSRGRKTLLTPTLQARACKLLRDGCNIKTACNICGVGETTYHEWKNRGRCGEEPYASFFSETSRAASVCSRLRGWQR